MILPLPFFKLRNKKQQTMCCVSNEGRYRYIFIVDEWHTTLVWTAQCSVVSNPCKKQQQECLCWQRQLHSTKYSFEVSWRALKIKETRMVLVAHKKYYRLMRISHVTCWTDKKALSALEMATWGSGYMSSVECLLRMSIEAHLVNLHI